MTLRRISGEEAGAPAIVAVEAHGGAVLEAKKGTSKGLVEVKMRHPTLTSVEGKGKAMAWHLPSQSGQMLTLMQLQQNCWSDRGEASQ